MKDLYHKLSLEPGSKETDIEQQIAQHPELSAYSAILLDRERRTFYDRTHATLRTIGELRHRLKLETGGSWFLEHYPDFAHRFNPALAPPPSKPAAPESAEADTGPEPGTQTPSRFVPLLLGGAVLVLLILALLYFLN